jgi:predicted phage baseplate assembly protein
MGCDNDCRTDPAFPRRIDNRPALPRVAYRIGGYTEMRAQVLSLIDQAPALAAWTHRGSDDPGIALVEAAAIVGDILSLYQDDHANEAWLRTARLPGSVTDLVRLLGYRPAPGVGGRARFALAVKGPTPVTVPAGLILEATLEGAGQPATFETSRELLAVPALSSFHLYRPRQVPDIVNGMDTFQLDAADAVALKPGDRLMVGLATGEEAQGAYDHTQVMEVDRVWEAFGIRYVKTKGQLQSLASRWMRGPFVGVGLSPVAAGLRRDGGALSKAVTTGAVFMATTAPQAGIVRASEPAALAAALATMAADATPFRVGVAALPAFSGLLAAGLARPAVSAVPRLVAWRLGASMRHFGHAAPATQVTIDADGRAHELPVPYDRVLDATQGAPAGPRLAARQLPVEGAATGLAAGTGVLVEAALAASAGAAPTKRVLARRITQVDGQSLAWGAQTGAATVATLDADLAVTDGGTALRWADIRGLTAHAVHGEAFALRAEPHATSAASGAVLDFYGSADDAMALLGRTLLLLEPDGPAAAMVQRVRRQTHGEPRFEVTLDRDVDYRLYGHDTPEVEVLGNLVEATEGKTQPETVLGDGDGRAVFQTFALPKAPLAHRLDPAASPPQVPEVEVRVDGLAWTRVESFFASGPRDTVYVVRATDDGGSCVQFGDGVHGARLPSGQGNVTASWRVGSGSRGPLKADTTVSAKPRFAGFDKARLPEPVTGGAAPESAELARLAAPGTMQSLGRIVSLADFETEARTLPGVLKARAAWLQMDGAPVLGLTVLIDGTASEADRAALDLALRQAVEARGPARCALWLRIGQRRFADVALRVGFDRRRRTADLEAALRLALGTCADDTALDDLPTGGLFDWRERTFGQDVHGSQIVARVQNVEGIAWVELTRLAVRAPTLARGLRAERAASVSPRPLPAAARRLRCPADALLALHQDQLAVDWVPVALDA